MPPPVISEDSSAKTTQPTHLLRNAGGALIETNLFMLFQKRACARKQKVGTKNEEDDAEIHR